MRASWFRNYCVLREQCVYAFVHLDTYIYMCTIIHAVAWQLPTNVKEEGV